MRGSSMQDVIFAGSDGRRAGGSAEVELTFDNADGALPLPVDEVSVMRRVARDGSSQYSINQSGVPAHRCGRAHGAGRSGQGTAFDHRPGQGRVIPGRQAGGPPRPDRRGRRAWAPSSAGGSALSSSFARCAATSSAPSCSNARSAPSSRRCAGRPARRSSCAASKPPRGDSRPAVDRRGRRPGRPAERAQGGARGAAGGARPRRAGTRGGGRRARRRGRGVRPPACRARARAKRLLRARVLDGRLESGRRLTEQRQRLLEEVERASAEERTRLLGELAGRPEESEEDSWPQEERRLAEALDGGRGGLRRSRRAAGAARELLGARRSSLAASPSSARAR